MPSTVRVEAWTSSATASPTSLILTTTKTNKNINTNRNYIKELIEIIHTRQCLYRPLLSKRRWTRPLWPDRAWKPSSCDAEWWTFVRRPSRSEWAAVAAYSIPLCCTSTGSCPWCSSRFAPVCTRQDKRRTRQTFQCWLKNIITYRYILSTLAVFVCEPGKVSLPYESVGCSVVHVV